MGTPYAGEIRLLPYFRGAPSGWLVCDGSLQQISGNPVLYQLLGTTYGGDGNTTFGLPDLRGRVPVHQGSGQGLTPRSLGSSGGTETVTLQMQQMGAHNHNMLASTTPATSTTPSGSVLAAIPSAVGEVFYVAVPQASDAVNFPGSMLQPSGGNGSHDNTAPTLVLQYCIAAEGLYPAQQ